MPTSNVFCGHINNLQNYIGLYCIYCGEPLIDIMQKDGQLVIRRKDISKVQKYLAVIYKGEQKIVEIINPTFPFNIKFEGEDAIPIESTILLKALQDQREILLIEEE